ncbi:MAG TPA: CBS domain-containing protein [Candidatus Accumulibacter phosphatis]|nr:MAG: putative manganese-dependent inorganic pyrophosphatase [Candidatus Accumulibacter sp. SK-11]HAY27032.1 CBS domain-containing protein [Accumulibacter sp.]HRL75819.1 CBS domain-containing protein [Candidatus Accumulibacter phosphatis]HCN66825.1 CBS domain-containing protein [Accumulibacter sp.]HCV12719.1 CBS domain-containing protein [Accumulibacter sp.]
MFAVYGLSGPIFRGAFERLGEVSGISRSRAVQPISEDEPRATTFATPTAQAIGAYRQMLRAEADRGPLYHAYQIMQRPVFSVFSQDAVERAWRLLLERRIHQAPVLDPGYRLVGIVSERDLLTTLNVDTGRPRDIMARQVADVMSTPVVSADPVTDIRRIAQVMLEHGVDGVPIVNESDALVGFVSRSDVLRAVVTDPPLSLWR